MNIVISGKISNSFQFISAIAAKKKISHKYKAVVYLKISYDQYWNKINIPKEMLNIIQMDFFKSIEIKPDKEFYCCMNNPRIARRNQIILDDGVGAYRKNPFILLKTKVKERKFKNEVKSSAIENIKYILILSIKMLHSTIHPGHISIFKKRPWNYFEIHEENKKYFLEAIEYISEVIGENCKKDGGNIVLFLSQPYRLIGFKSSEEYEIFMKKISDFFKKENPDADFVIKMHPVDDFDYSNIEAKIAPNNSMPAEIFFHQYKGKILKVIGFSSTSLLTGKILFNIPSFYIERFGNNSVTGDFWVDHGFRKHLNPLVFD